MCMNTTSLELTVKAQNFLARMREERGQTAAEYLGIVVVVAAIIAAIVGAGLDDKIAKALSGAVDKIAGWMFRQGEGGGDKIFYTTGRLTSEMVLKTVRMGIPILVSRSGFTAWGVELARQVGLTLIGRARGKRFLALSGEDRIVFDQDLAYVEDESAKHRRKGAGDA